MQRASTDQVSLELRLCKCLSHGESGEVNEPKITYGFVIGPAKITQLFSDPKHGEWLEISGKLERVAIRVTKGGRIRIGYVFKIKQKKK